MSTATHPPRRIEDICPPWCAGHTGTYQGWEILCDGTGLLRDHAEAEGARIGNVWLTLLIEEALSVVSGGHEHREPMIDILVDNADGHSSNFDLTLAQARELAEALLARVERAEAHR